MYARARVYHRSLFIFDCSPPVIVLAAWLNPIKMIRLSMAYSRKKNFYVHGRLSFSFFISCRKREMVPMKSLDEARKSFGTDEDILLVRILY